MEDRVRRVFDGKLYLLSSHIPSQQRHEHKGCVQPGGHSGSGDEVPVHHDPGLRKNRAVVRHQVSCGPVCCDLSPCKNAGRAAEQRSCADGKQNSFGIRMPANEGKQLFIVHEGVLPVTAGHNQHIKGSRFRDSYVRSKPQPLDVANGSKFFSHDRQLVVGHA